MKAEAIRRFRQKLAADEPVYGLWVTLESASITEMAVAIGLDWVVIDAEHGQLDWREILEHLRATARSHTVAIVRLAELNGGLIKRTLDIGADGVMIPWVETPAQAREAVALANYPPAGKRGIGGERATAWGRCVAEHVAEAKANVLVVPIIETVTGARHIEEICSVPGLGYIQLGPADFSSSAGYAGQWEGPGVAEQLLAVKDAARRHGLACGVLSTGNENLSMRKEQGFRVLGVGSDAGLLLRGMSAAMESQGRKAALRTDFSQQ